MMIGMSGKYGNKLSIIKSSLRADAIDPGVSGLAVAYFIVTVPHAEWLTEAPSGHVASALAVFSVPSGVGGAGQALIVDQIKSTVADACSVDSDLVGSTSDGGRNNHG